MSSYYEKFIATGEVKCIDEEIPFEIPQGWEWCRLGELITYQNGYSYTSAELNKECKGLPVIKSGNLMTYEVVLKPNNDYVESPSDKMLASLIRKGDMLMCLSSQSDNPEPLGKTAIYRNDNYALLNQRVLKMRPHLDGILDYLYYVINSEYFHYTVSHQSGGSAQANLKLGHVLSMLVPIAPFEEELRIVNKISKLNPFIAHYDFIQQKESDLNNEINNKLKKSILQEAIQGRLVPQMKEEGTAQELLEQIRQEKQKLVKEGKLKKSVLIDSVIYKDDDNKYYEHIGKKCLDITEQIPFEIPENWVWARMGQIGDWGAGSTPQRGNANYYNGDILWLKTGELNNGIVYDTEEKVTLKAFQECSLRMNKIGDVLIAMYGATIGKLAIVGKKLTTNQACCGCTPYLIYNWYLFYFLMASRDSFIKKGEGGAQPNISRVKLIEHLIPLPPLKEQYRIVTQIEKLFEQLQ
ncbi:restriction endonuclease subunit S [Bacteroides clarus]|uniref:restriction endonuclease subunit S n=1 Tax=Bacteroides clarus TaxID=626929 RepID=UPI0024B25F75|nr:restriction endonuclease subunit S [Bacteroides clarus]